MQSSQQDEISASLVLSRRTLLAALGAASMCASGEAEARVTAASGESAASAATSLRTSADALKTAYFDSLQTLQRAHMRLLDVVRDEFERKGRHDVSAEEALILMEIGGGEIEARAFRSLIAPLRGNLYAKLARLEKHGFVRRTTKFKPLKIALTPKGQLAADIATSGLTRHLSSVQALAGVTPEQLAAANATFARLERYWSDAVAYRI